MNLISTYIRAFRYMKSMRLKYFTGSFFSSLEFVFLFATPVVNRMLVDMMVLGSSGDTLKQLILIMLGLLALTPLIVLGYYWQNTCAQKLSDNVKKDLFLHILKLPLKTLYKLQTGDYLIRLTQDTESVGNWMFSGLPIVSLIRFVMLTLVTMILLTIADWRIAILAVVYSLVCLVMSLILNPYVQKLERRAKQEIAASSNIVLETMRSLPIVRVFMIGSTLAGLYHRRCEVVRNKRAKFRAINGVSYGVMDIFSFSAQAVGFMAAIFLLMRGETNLGDAVYMASLMALASNGLLSFSTFILWIQPSLVSAKRVFEILDEKCEDEDYGADTGVQDVAPNISSKEAICIKNMSFAYSDGTRALHDINLSISNGENIAFIGASGGGKSTLAQIIASLYEPSEGSITFYGVDGRSLSRKKIRELIAYVPQEPVLFDGTIYDNIALGKSDATDEEIKQATKEAGLEDFILSQPEGYDVEVGERGTTVSGGQRQRIAIARAILKNAPILILDEATSALDSDTEAQVQKSLDKLAKGRTTITVAHRMSTIKNADRVITLENGRIVQ